MASSAPETRAAAKAAGIKTYFTGRPCPQGHVADRRTHNSECVECGRIKARERQADLPHEVKIERGRRYWARNAGAIAVRRRAGWKANPRPNLELQAAWNSGKGKEYKRTWTAQNRVRLNALNRKWKKANPEAVKASSARYQKNNPHIGQLATQRRRARKAGAEGLYTQADVVRIFKAQKGRCAACGDRKKLTVDHIVPLNKGGSNWPSNLQGLCLSCNCSKSDKDPLEFMRLMGALL